MTTLAAELLDPATAAAMLATALRYPLHLAADVALPVVEAVERAWCWADSRATHWAWLLSFLGFGAPIVDCSGASHVIVSREVTP